MNPNRRIPRSSGFTLVEAIIVLALIGIISAMTLPAIERFIFRGKIEGFAQSSAMFVQEARYEAIRRGVPCVVRAEITAGTNGGELIAFADVHGATLADPSDGIFNPIAGQPYRSTDYELRRDRLPSGVTFRSATQEGSASIDGFVNTGNPDPPDLEAILLPSGSALTAGAFRIGDQRGNYLEIRIDPPATGRVELRKWNGSNWLAQGAGGEQWEWH